MAAARIVVVRTIDFTVYRACALLREAFSKFPLARSQEYKGIEIMMDTEPTDGASGSGYRPFSSCNGSRPL